jgi:phosphoribosylamine---glycine ligase
MRILIVGHGGREHAITEAIANSSWHPDMYAWMSYPNPGIASHCSEYAKGSMRDQMQIADYAWEKRVDLVVAGPEEPLIYGVADELARRGIPCVGPRQQLAKLEGDKSFFRQMAGKYLPEANARFYKCKTGQEIEQALTELGDVAIKPLGLTSGKGVRVMGKQLPDLAAGYAYASQLLQQDGAVLVEERLVGEEFSQMVFTDGISIHPMPLVQDAKYAFEGDCGPMTGGMGAYSMPDHLLPFISSEARWEAIEMLGRLLTGVQDELQLRYHGCLYGQFIMTQNGPRIVEVNVRLGDPEAINVMANLVTDAVDVFVGIVSGLQEKVEFKAQATICKYLVPVSYPEKPVEEICVRLNPHIFEEEHTQIILAGAEKDNDMYCATGSRFAAVLAIRDSLAEAERAVEKTIQRLELKGMRHRSDIGKEATILAKQAFMRNLVG